MLLTGRSSKIEPGCINSGVTSSSKPSRPRASRPWLLPGIHRGSDMELPAEGLLPRHEPGKGGAWPPGVFLRKADSLIVCDASSNTVTFAVVTGKIIGAIDAPIFAPGLMQGPLDVQANRDVDSGKMTANQAFNCGGSLQDWTVKPGECLPEEESLALESLSYSRPWRSMPSSSSVATGASQIPTIPGGKPAAKLCRRVSQLLGREVLPLDSSAAAVGCAWIAKDVFGGSRSILGLEVDM